MIRRYLNVVLDWARFWLAIRPVRDDLAELRNASSGLHEDTERFVAFLRRTDREESP